MHKKEKAQTLKNNVKYLIKSRGETQLSLSNASGLTRTTIYNILEGRVTNVQRTTIRKISDFFGVSYREIESVDLEEREIIESSASLHGNMNPAAVPIIKESELIQSLKKKIGELVVEHPLTYYFGVGSNLIGVLLENDIEDMYEAGALLVVKKGTLNSEGERLIYKQSTKELLIVIGGYSCSDVVLVIGDVVEERFNGR
ncbi:helix-turn-helix transcriptional regulator [Pseudomonas sp. ABY48]|uniref:helix-turn-helix transcriptional regulator n=1 Tax=Pseudomonas TaxID=286 RepID=UPI001DC4126C|nr:helix-turn-helix transcriptional regulator [Pseudomonas brassicacearum]CAH0237886.1 hypothetical protein SRABI06_02816 [Pseudomonas brassicacearum]